MGAPVAAPAGAPVAAHVGTIVAAHKGAPVAAHVGAPVAAHVGGPVAAHIFFCFVLSNTLLKIVSIMRGWPHEIRPLGLAMSSALENTL